MKILISSLLLASCACAQNAPDAKIVTFNRADTAHCRVVQINGKSLLESSMDGLSVAISMPENRGNGEFSVFVSIYNEKADAAHVNPKEFSAVYSDPTHTRFPFYDKASEVEARDPGQGPEAGMSAQNTEVDRSMIRGGPTGPGAAGRSASDTLKGDNVPNRNLAPGQSPDGTPTSAVFLHKATLKQGSKAAGLVFFRKPKGAKVEIGSATMPDEIDIPINGILFRF